MSKLTIKQQELELVSARLEPFLDNDAEEPAETHRFVWGVLVEAKAKDVAGSTWEPSFTSERVLETKPNELESWQNLAGRHGEWTDDEEMATLYTVSHEAVIDVTWRFERASSGRLRFVLDGRSRFRQSGEYEGLIPIHLEAELEYAPIPMGPKTKEAACRRQMARFGLKDPFAFKVQDGVSYLAPTNYPTRER
jgi:hypothetical protein